MHYLLVARNTRFWLVGPFDTHEASGEWGCDETNNPGDDPRWQTIELVDASLPVTVLPPDAPMDPNPD